MNAAAYPLTLRDRIARLTHRERIFLTSGAAAIVMTLLYLLLPVTGGVEASIELADAPSAAAAVLPASPPPAEPSGPPPASAEGIVLRGVFGGGPREGAAILLLPGGAERVVPIGREFLPGLRLKTVGVSHAILATSAGEVRIEIGRAGSTALTSASPASVPANGPGGSVDHRRETVQYRLGLEPRKSNGRIAGFAIRPGARMPQLERAGLRPGDVIVGVNGSAFDEERMLELSWEMANSSRTEFEFLRGGRRMKATAEVSGR